MDKGIDNFKKAVEIVPDYYDAHRFLAILYNKKEEYDLAYKHAAICERLGRPIE